MLSEICLAQAPELTEGSDTTSFKSHLKRIETFKIQNLLKSDDPKTWRFWGPPMLIELKYSDTGLEGRFVTMVISKDKKTMDETYVNEHKLSADEAQALGSLIDRTNINSIPSDAFIDGWEHGFDGVTYTIEYSDGLEYSIKHYWTPSSQENVKEASQIVQFMDEMNDLISGPDDNIPYKQYTYYGVSYTIYNLNWKRSSRRKASGRNER